MTQRLRQQAVAEAAALQHEAFANLMREQAASRNRLYAEGRERWLVMTAECGPERDALRLTPACSDGSDPFKRGRLDRKP